MSGISFILLADAADRAVRSVEFWLSVGLLILILLAGAVILYLTDLWRKRQFASSRDSTESLTSFRAMFERGELTEAEYQAVRDRVAAKMRQEVGATPPIGVRSGAEAATSNGEVRGEDPREEPPAPNGQSPDPPSAG